jgi:hypothetical protein
LALGDYEIEPKETDTICADYIVENECATIQIDSYLKNKVNRLECHYSTRPLKERSMPPKKKASKKLLKAAEKTAKKAAAKKKSIAYQHPPKKKPNSI